MASKTLERLLLRLRQLRDAHGLTQEQFAEMSGISYKVLPSRRGGAETRTAAIDTGAVGRSVHGIEPWQISRPLRPKRKRLGSGCPEGNAGNWSRRHITGAMSALSPTHRLDAVGALPED